VASENESVGDFTGSTIVVTGASSGVGRAAAIGFARRGARVALVGRDQARLDEAVAGVRAAAPADVAPAGYVCDFASLEQVRGLAADLADAYPRIDVLANNAGAVIPSRVTTVDGHELTIQANHLAPFLLTTLLRERLAGGRVVNTSSAAHSAGRLDPDDLDSTRQPYRALRVYGASKQANILFAAEAVRRWPEILSFSYHPGVVRSRFGRDSWIYAFFYRYAPFLVTPEQGADTLLFLAGAPATELTGGGYYRQCRLKRPSPPNGSPEFASRLWEATTKALGF
jgi:NAD(P)-dependent dehydrogenase (short-subunit alcohol dehydrogenase family)